MQIVYTFQDEVVPETVFVADIAYNACELCADIANNSEQGALYGMTNQVIGNEITILREGKRNRAIMANMAIIGSAINQNVSLYEALKEAFLNKEAMRVARKYLGNMYYQFVEELGCPQKSFNKVLQFLEDERNGIEHPARSTRSVKSVRRAKRSNLSTADNTHPEQTEQSAKMPVKPVNPFKIERIAVANEVKGAQVLSDGSIVASSIEELMAKVLGDL